MSDLSEFVRGRIWLREYPVRYAGANFRARMSVLRLTNGRLLIHSPCDFDDVARSEIADLGEVAHIIAPGTYHYFHVASWQRAFPSAKTHLCPGIEKKVPNLSFDAMLGDESDPDWASELDQVFVGGARFMAEVAFYDRVSQTLFLVDLVENIGDETPGTDWILRFWWKGVMRMWNRARPAPEYQLGWGDRRKVAAALSRILTWDFERVVIAHGDLIERDAKDIVREAWTKPLRVAEQ